MADIHAKSKCFILTPDGYEEISYTELCLRQTADTNYKDRRFIPIHGMLLEVPQEEYAAYYRAKNRRRYLAKLAAKCGEFSTDMLTTDEFNGMDIFVDPGEPVEEVVIQKVLTGRLRACLLRLTQEERELIVDIFYRGLSERDAAKLRGVSQMAIHKRKVSILEKIKIMLI